MRKSIFDLDENLKMNATRWNDTEAWRNRDHLGYSWDNGVVQLLSSVARLADGYLRPHLDGRYDLKILELSPGGGRFTRELLRYASALDLLDMNQACLDICSALFSELPTPMRFFKNDGQSVDMVEDRDYDLIACFDSMVHMHPDIINGYVDQFAARIKPGGIIWLDHSGKGPRETGHRTDMTPEKMADFARAAGLSVVWQKLRNDHDCVSVLTKST